MLLSRVTLSAALIGTALSGAVAAEPPIAFEDASAEIPFFSRSTEFGGTGVVGAVWFDADRDGAVDLFLPNGPGLANALYRNQGDGTFVDRAAAAGLAASFGAGGGLAADLDNDGFQELLLTSDANYFNPAGETRLGLFRNHGDGTFTDVTAAAGITGPSSNFSAAAADVDNDGDLDLFLTAAGSLVTAETERNRIYRNDGGLRFTDVSAGSGVDTELGACVATFSYYDADPWIDLFVGNCNDQIGRILPLQLFRNNGDFTFTDVAAAAGLTDLGFWMGLAFGDSDNDGDTDIFVSNGGDAPPLGPFPHNYPHGFYRNNGDGTYTNLAAALDLGSYRWTWGNAMKDFDNDGHLDLFFTGALPSPFAPVFIGPGGEANPGVLWANDGQGGWTDISATLPYDFRRDFSSGVAAGDYDADGFEDLLVMVTSAPPYAGNGQPVLLHNVTRNGNGWLQVRTLGTASNRDGVGARVTVRAGGLTQMREVYAGSSLASMHSQTLTFGLGSHREATVDVLWPSGYRNRLDRVAAGSDTVIPEIPCSFDDPELAFPAYRACVAGALDGLQEQGLVTPQESARLLASAVRAYHDVR